MVKTDEFVKSKFGSYSEGQERVDMIYVFLSVARQSQPQPLAGKVIQNSSYMVCSPCVPLTILPLQEAFQYALFLSILELLFLNLI